MKGSNQFLNGGYWIITKGIQDMKVLRDGKSHCNCYADIDYIRYIGNFCKASHLLIGPNSMKARHTACVSSGYYGRQSGKSQHQRLMVTDGALLQHIVFPLLTNWT